MSAPLPAERIIGGTDVEVAHPAGALRFQELRRGEWLTLKGEPAKKESRGYWLDGEPLDSISNIVGALDKPALRYWLQDHSARGAVQAERMGELEGVPEEEYLDRVSALGLGPDAARDEGAERGTAVHLGLHTYVTTGEPPNPADYPALWHPWLRGAMRAALALGLSPENVIGAEFFICHPELRYAGRPDLYVICDRLRTLIDYKTGKGKVYTQAHWQTRGYADSFEHCELEPPDRILIVGIDDQGGFDLVECDKTSEEWRALVTVYRSDKRTEQAMAAQRKLAKAAIKAAA